MHHLLRKQVIIAVILFLVGAGNAGAQYMKEVYRPYHDDMTYYFGLSLGYNSTFLNFNKSAAFLQTDSIIAVEPGKSGGVTMGLLATARLNEHFQFRINPLLVIGGAKYLSYTLKTRLPGEDIEQLQTLPATIVSFPFQIKFNSDRIRNFRTYMMAGLKYDIDLSSNSTARSNQDLIKLSRTDYGYELGLGFNFYLPFVTISPEIKISNGLANLHRPDPALKYSNVIYRIFSRMVVFSLHFED
ncbi:MAG: outer membrane beta-barrel protein [Bacteroidota bacterium]